MSATEIDAKGNRVTSDPNLRPQYIVVTYRAKEDLFVEIANVLRTSILRQVVRAGETTVVVADVTPRQSDGDWTVQIDWRNRLPGGLARSAYPTRCCGTHPGGRPAAAGKAAPGRGDGRARWRNPERQAAYNRQAEEARKIALANLARQNAEDTTTLRRRWSRCSASGCPYTRSSRVGPESPKRIPGAQDRPDRRRAGRPDAAARKRGPRPRAPKCRSRRERQPNVQGRGLCRELPAGPGQRTILHAVRQSRLRLAEAAGRADSGGTRSRLLDLRKAPGVTILREAPGARPMSPRVDGTALEAYDRQRRKPRAEPHRPAQRPRPPAGQRR